MSKPVTPLVDQTDLGGEPSAAEVAALQARTTFVAASDTTEAETKRGAWLLTCEANYVISSGRVGTEGNIVHPRSSSFANPLSNLPTGPGSMS
jgi:hypothetical protein